jgi:hypothetical protein
MVPGCMNPIANLVHQASIFVENAKNLYLIQNKYFNLEYQSAISLSADPTYLDPLQGP